MRLYATPADYEAAHGDAPATIDRLLRTASHLVDLLLVGVEYDTDPDGMPTHPDVAQAMTDAVVDIAASMDANGSLAQASADEWDSVKIGTVTLSGRSGSTTATTVAGVPIPAGALVALASIGPVRVRTGNPPRRPLDRVDRGYKLVQE